MQESTFSIQMNGKEYQVEPGQTILDVAQTQDYFVPSVCYHPNLGSIQTCDTCFVNVNGQMVRACTTKAEPGMKVDTLSKPIKDAQYEAMSRILKTMNFIVPFVITIMEIVSYIILSNIWNLNIKHMILTKTIPTRHITSVLPV